MRKIHSDAVWWGMSASVGLSSIETGAPDVHYATTSDSSGVRRTVMPGRYARARLRAMVALPIPVPAGTPSWVGAVFVVASAAVLVVLIWQAVRYFRANRDDDRDDDDRNR